VKGTEDFLLSGVFFTEETKSPGSLIVTTTVLMKGFYVRETSDGLCCSAHHCILPHFHSICTWLYILLLSEEEKAMQAVTAQSYVLCHAERIRGPTTTDEKESWNMKGKQRLQLLWYTTKYTICGMAYHSTFFPQTGESKSAKYMYNPNSKKAGTLCEM